MDAITSDQIRTWSKLDFVDLGYEDGSPDPLDVEVSRAVAYCEDVTGQVTAEITNATNLAVKMAQAIQLRVEQQITQRQEGYVADVNEDAVDFDVTGYKQKRISHKERDPSTMINPWKELNDLLVSMLTDEMFEYWEDLGKLPGSNIIRPEEVRSTTEWFYTEDI
jgi:hypothetical protein